MTRKLNRTVVAGGVLYSAGTASTPDLEKAITNPAFWDGDAPEPKPRKRAEPKPKSDPKGS